MNKDEMIKDIPTNIIAYDGNPKGQHLYIEQRKEIAEALYNAGYRKVGEDDILISKEAYYEALNAAQESGKRMGYAQGRDETVRKILEFIGKPILSPYHKGDDWYEGAFNKQKQIRENIAKKFGIELEG